MLHVSLVQSGTDPACKIGHPGVRICPGGRRFFSCTGVMVEESDIPKVSFKFFQFNCSSRSLTEVVLPRSFYNRNSLVVAKDLIGNTLVRTTDAGSKLEGIIVEVEAYGGSRDPASHAFPGKTKRNAVMFGEPGHAYVYFTYGAHYCLNFVCSPGRSRATAVLLRALQPTKGIEEMAQSRGTKVLTELASGPGKLCNALGIDLKSNGMDLTSSDSKIIVLDTKTPPFIIAKSPRIGITRATEKLWRFYAKDSRFVSRRNFTRET
jgi:DNA-3-methyladenine glycosylase